MPHSKIHGRSVAHCFYRACADCPPLGSQPGRTQFLLEALVIGLAEPAPSCRGISRSGITISAARMTGLNLKNQRNSPSWPVCR